MKIIKYPLVSLIIDTAGFIILLLDKPTNDGVVIAFYILSAVVLGLILVQLFNAYGQFSSLNRTIESILNGNLDARANSHNEKYDRELIANLNRLAKRLEKVTNKKDEDELTIKILTNSITSPIVYVDLDGRIRYVNNEFVNCFQVLVEVNDIYEKLRVRKVYKFIDDAFVLETELSRMLQIEDRYYQANAIPINNYQAKFIGILFIFYDITDLKKYEKLQREFLADASHELKTPISAIKGASEILLDGDDHSKETVEEFLNIIQKENKRMERIVADILLISRLENETLMMHTVKLDVMLLLHEVISSLSFRIEDKHQNLIVNIEKELFIEGDFERLKHAFLNLLINAINYTNENKSIFITAWRDDEHVHVSIRDEGIGMEEKDIPHIFERFYRIDKARSRETGGTGLGLAIVKSVLDMHKAKIQVKSTPEVGTEFIIIFKKYEI